MVIYGHPEAYPPTLNAVACLAQDFTIKVIHRAHQQSNWPYPAGVELIADGEVLSARAQEQLPIWRKVGLFLRFCFLLWQSLWKYQPKVVLMYDALGVLSYRWVSKFIFFAPLLWYHNHDVYDPQVIRKNSLSWWAIKAESWVFSKLNIFSLPAMDRKSFFPMDQLKGQFFFLPNYPSVAFYRPYYRPQKQFEDIRILFQGQLGIGHGIEEVLALMPLSIQGIPVKLVLRGHARKGYDRWLDEQVKNQQLEGLVEVHGFTPYKNIPLLGAECHIGLAVFTKKDVMNRTIGTASNKIYEYAALGLPILYYADEYFHNQLKKFKWAIPTDLSADSLTTSITEIIANYEQLSGAAHQDFVSTLNFESHFNFVQVHLNSLIENRLIVSP